MALPAGAKLLENSTSRNDWREYWPIRKFLLEKSLAEDSFYGFFSPKFVQKTALRYEDVENFIRSAEPGMDVFLFSHSADRGAFSLNVFEQYEFMEPGFMACCDAFFDHIGLEVDLRRLVMDSRQIVFSNYFVARPRFWRRWLEWNEKLFSVCEGPDSELKRLLTAATGYTDGVEHKVFIMERIASLLLTLEDWNVLSYNTFQLGWSYGTMRKYPAAAVVCDALKMAMKEQDFWDYRQLYEMTRAPALL